MSFDPDSLSDRADLEEFREVAPCPRCHGMDWTPIRGAGNPMAVEPCGCDQIEEDED